MTKVVIKILQTAQGGPILYPDPLVAILQHLNKWTKIDKM